jgi:hypothetical protein
MVLDKPEFAGKTRKIFPVQDQFPTDVIKDHIMAFGGVFKEIEAIKSKSDPSKEEKKRLEECMTRLIQGLVLFTWDLEQRGLDPKLVIPSHVAELFGKMVSETESTRKQHEDLLEMLRNPIIEQKQVWDEAAPDI